MKPNSPEAAARLLAATVMADGMASAAEMSLLERQALQLGLNEPALREIVRELCEERQLFSDSSWCAGPCDDQADSLMAAITEPALRRRLLQMAAELAQADRHLSDGEGQLLRKLQRAWQPAEALIA